MQVTKIYSHLNGLEFLEARKPNLWDEIKNVIAAVDAAKCLTKVSKEKTKTGKTVYSPKALNDAFKMHFKALPAPWKAERANYFVCNDVRINRLIVDLATEKQKEVIEGSGLEAHRSYNQTDFVKDRVAVEVQFGKYSFIAYDLFVKHLAFYVADKIDVGIEIIPMKALQSHMSSGPGYYEAELFNLMREGRGIPGVPLVLIGVSP